MKGKGFTLIEMLLVVTIIVLVGTIVGHRFYEGHRQVDLRSAAHGVLNMARYGRLLAAEHHRPCTLHINLDEGRYWLTSRKISTGKEDEFGAAEERIVEDAYMRPGVLPATLHFVQAQVEGSSCVTEGEITISFHVDGSAEAALVQVGADQKIYTLLIYPWTGRAQLKAQAIDELPIDTQDLGKSDGF